MQLLGEFYNEKVISLGRDKLYTKELRLRLGEIRIEKELFFWRLYSGKRYIECKSEDEAVYLKVFWEAGLSEVEVPKDEQYLKEILPELTRLKSRHDEVIEDHVDGLLNSKLRQRALNQIWSDIFNDEYVDYESLEI